MLFLYQFWKLEHVLNSKFILSQYNLYIKYFIYIYPNIMHIIAHEHVWQEWRLNKHLNKH